MDKLKLEDVPPDQGDFVGVRDDLVNVRLFLALRVLIALLNQFSFFLSQRLDHSFPEGVASEVGQVIAQNEFSRVPYWAVDNTLDVDNSIALRLKQQDRNRFVQGNRLEFPKAIRHGQGHSCQQRQNPVLPDDPEIIGPVFLMNQIGTGWPVLCRVCFAFHFIRWAL